MIMWIALVVCLLWTPSEGALQKVGDWKTADEYDVIIFVANLQANTTGDETLKVIIDAVHEFAETNPLVYEEISIIPFPQHASKRIIYSPTGRLNRDFDDSRSIYEAASKGMQKAHQMKIRSPLLMLGPLTPTRNPAVWMDNEFPILNAVMGALNSAYTPIEVREALPSKATKFDKIGVFGAGEHTLNDASSMEAGRGVARDICGSDPERMAAIKIVEYLKETFPEGLEGFTMTVDEVDPKKYPFSAAVDRAASTVPRHAGRIVKMEYTGKGEIEETLILTGKGITFDTGGANIKIKNYMNGMHRDKCGAAAVAGFFSTLIGLRPPNLKVIGFMAFVRNSAGADAYLPDEILTSLAGRRVRVVNTDAEGRVVLSDMMYYAKEEALKAKNPHIYSIATLTGHAKKAVLCYSIAMDNGPAAKKMSAQSLQLAGDHIADLFEISTIRREDHAVVQGQSEYEDLMQSFHRPMNEYGRGHQFPAAYMMHVSGLDEHGLDSTQPIPYTHLDIYPAIGGMQSPPTGVPIMALSVRYVLPRLGRDTATLHEVLSKLV